MGLADEARAVPVGRWSRPIVDAWLGEQDAADLAELLADPTVPARRIWVALRARGCGVSESSVVKWADRARH